MINTREAKGIVWTDLQSPTNEEISNLVQRYKLHPLVGEGLRDSPSLAKIDFHKDYILAVLSFPVRIKKDGGYRVIDREVDFVIGKDFLITAHPDGIEQLEYFGKIFETNAILDKNSEIENTGHLFYHMVMRLYAGMCEDLQNIRDTLVTAEERIFKGDERATVTTLSELSRELIDFRETARIHRDIWEDMINHFDKSFLGQDFEPYIRSMRDEFIRINELLRNSRELVSDLRETNDSLLNTKQNNIIRTLTIVTFIFYPATFIAALFTIPAAYVPLIENPSGWNIILAGMIVITIGIWIFVKRRKWL